MNSYYASISATTGDALLQQLRTLITDTHKTITSYDDCKEYLPYADEDLDNSSNMVLFYSGVSISKNASVGNGVGQWNREHIWPQSLGWFSTSGAGSDLHHIRPTNGSINSTRNNKKYGEVTNGTIVHYPNSDIVSGSYSTNYFEPNDEVKGDIARIIFYLMVRYSEADTYSFESVAQSYEVLKSWNTLDPVSDAERARNEYIYTIQGNRNPFIDNSNYATMIWG